MADQEETVSKSLRMSRPAPRHKGPLAKVLEALQPLSLRDARRVLSLAEQTLGERVRQVMVQDLPDVSLDVLKD